MTVTYHPEVVQGSDEWKALRCGLLTASEMKFLLTPGLKVAGNDKTRAHFNEILAQRITGYVEPSYVSDDMLRGWADEIEARSLYAERYSAVTEVGFITKDFGDLTLGYSPDGLVGDYGLIECKSRRQKYQIQTILDHVKAQTIPQDYVLQIQTGLLVTGREWCDFVSYCGGLHMCVIRAYPNIKIMAAIHDVALMFENELREELANYKSIIGMASSVRLTPTERRDISTEIVL